MKLRHLFGALCLAAAPGAFAYTGTSLHAYSGAGNLVQPSGKKDPCVWTSGPRLTGKWQSFGYSFTPEADGMIGMAIGPQGDGAEGIPFYYDNLKINGEPVDNAKGWTFYPSPNGPGSLVAEPGFSPSGKPCLKLYHWGAVRREFFAKKGEKVEITMQAKAGSVLEVFAAKLAETANNVDEALKVAAGCPQASGCEQETEDKVVKSLNELVELSKARLGVEVAPLPPGTKTPEALKAKMLELSKACDAERAKQADAERPSLYDQPKERLELRAKLLELNRLAAELKTDFLLKLMFS